ncbi:MAG: transpeptidase family protein [Ichthyobacteriaceae bacterium]|nr:transpeptidase family protein [Ichthyobacteriaceae bacterium]
MDGVKYRAVASSSTIKPRVIKARRGNIYSRKGNLLATSIAKYSVAIDPSVANDKLFNDNIDALSDSLYRMFNAKNKYYYANKITRARKRGSRYLLLKKRLTYDEYQRLKAFPIFNKGRFKGGLVSQETLQREHPLGKVAERTIGYENESSISVGLEGAYSTHLSGVDGLVMSVKLQKQAWKPVNDNNEIEPMDGADIYTTIDVHIQDVAHHALLRSLERFEADHGTVVVMEVSTGKVRAIVNLAKTTNNKYFEKINYAVYELNEPGSTFKLPALVAALEDGIVDVNTVIDTKSGKFKINGSTVRDSHKGGFGKVTVREMFEKSSNIGMARIIHENYKSKPEQFLQRLYSMGLNKKVNVSIAGESDPVIPNPKDGKWSGISLPWMAYGYGVRLTPLQILTYYNAIANDGVQVKPYFVSEIKNEEGEVYSVGTTVLNSRICSEETVKIAQSLLRGVVANGTGKTLDMENLKISGKTGTTQANYWKGKNKVRSMQYVSSFVGYFPSDAPKYSMIVVVSKPNKRKGYYGATVAGPVFKEVAVKIYHEGTNLKFDTPFMSVDELSAYIEKENKTNKRPIRKNTMPNVKGMSAMNALPILENLGLKVSMSGVGRVVGQSIRTGSRIKKNNKVSLRLL